MECGKGVKIDSGYVWTAVTITLECVPGKGIIEFLWSSLNVWRPSKFSFRDFLSVPIPIWNCGIIKLRARQRIIGPLWSSLNVWRPSKFSFRYFLSVTYIHLELWYHKAQIRAWQRGHRASSLNVWRLSNYFYLEFFYRLHIPVALWTTRSKKFLQISPTQSQRVNNLPTSMTRSLPSEASGQPVGRDF